MKHISLQHNKLQEKHCKENGKPVYGKDTRAAVRSRIFMSPLMGAQNPTGESRTLIGGQTRPEMVGMVHRGYSGSEPVELLVFYAGSHGLPLPEPIKIE